MSGLNMENVKKKLQGSQQKKVGFQNVMQEKEATNQNWANLLKDFVTMAQTLSIDTLKIQHCEFAMKKTFFGTYRLTKKEITKREYFILCAIYAYCKYVYLIDSTTGVLYRFSEDNKSEGILPKANGEDIIQMNFTSNPSSFKHIIQEFISYDQRYLLQNCTCPEDILIDILEQALTGDFYKLSYFNKRNSKGIEGISEIKIIKKFVDWDHFWTTKEWYEYFFKNVAHDYVARKTILEAFKSKNAKPNIGDRLSDFIREI